MKVDKLFVESAISIRNRYIFLMQDYQKYESIMNDLVKKIDDAMQDLISYKEKYKTELDSNNIDDKTLKYINDVLSTIELLNNDSAKIEMEITPILSELAKLAEEENDLYDKMRNVYIDSNVLEEAVMQIKNALGDKESSN